MTPTTRPRSQILFVDDNPGDVQLLTEAFRDCRLPVELHSVANAFLAYQFLRKRGAYVEMPTPDLIILDLNLPIINGREILREIRKHPTWRSIPVAVFSSTKLSQDVEFCGAYAAFFASKPPTFDQLKQVARQFAKLATGGEAVPSPKQLV